MGTKRKVTLYDTTLRDGAQGEGIHFVLKDKLAYVQRMQAWGLAYIEAGWPGANPKDAELFAALRTLGAFEHEQSRITAFGSTCKAGEKPENSKILLHLADSGAKTCAIFGKTWRLHVQEVLKTDDEENRRLIRESVAYLVQAGKEVFFDAEHFFDGWQDDPDASLRFVEAAILGGARGIVLCDTNGGALPDSVRCGVEAVARRFAPPVLGIHVHNDCGLAVANSLAGVEAGANQVQGTWNGFGERCGNANLGTVASVLQLKMGYEVVTAEALMELTHLSRYVADLANTYFDERQPFLGRSAFAHKAGMHVDAVLKDNRTFEHINPALVGNVRRILISEQAGTANVWERMRKLDPGLSKDHPLVAQAMIGIKEKENHGYHFETAEGSLELFLLDVLGKYQAPFLLEDYHVWSDPSRGQLDAVAVVKVKVGEESVHMASEGEGPVNALDRALRKTLSTFFPFIEGSELIDYKVRVLDGSSGTSAQVRVVLETRYGVTKWGTIGVSTNILRASAQALLDSMYVLILKEQGAL